MIGPTWMGFLTGTFLGLGSWWRRNRKRRWVRGGAAVVVAVGLAVGAVTLHKGQVPSPPDTHTVLLLKADTDFPALSDRTTFCAGSDHCWLFGPSGTITDQVGSWDLGLHGSLNTGIETGLPVYSGGAVSWTGEQAAAFVNDYYYYLGTSPAQTEDNLVSITALVRTTAESGGDPLYAQYSGNGYILYVGFGKVKAFVGGTVGTAYLYGKTPFNEGAWHCVTVVLDGRSANAARAFLDGKDDTDTSNDDLSGTGAWSASVSIEVGRRFAPDAEIARLRVDNSALTLADHQAICGSWGAPIRRTHPAFADTSWTQTGGARCFEAGSGRAVCFPGGLPGYAYSSALGGRGWAVEPGRINRITYNTAIDCTNWTCRGTGTATPGKVAPDGSATATEVEVGLMGNDVLQAVSGYTASAALYPRLWVKCVAGDLRLTNSSGTGRWNVDCAVASNGAWAQIASETDPGVSPITPWAASAAGAGSILFAAVSGTVTAQIWAPTLTETPGLSVIPTGAAAVDTGDVAFAVDNTSGAYWGNWYTRDETRDPTVGGCFVAGSNLLWSGLGSYPCTATLDKLAINSKRAYPVWGQWTTTDITQNWLGMIIRAGVAWQIDWGDGTVSSFMGTGAAQDAVHNYANASTHTVTLSVDDPTALIALKNYNNSMSGGIPSLVNATGLDFVHLGQQSLTGSIPSLWHSEALRYFYAHQNQLSGGIPCLSHNSILKVIVVHTNQLTAYAASTIAATCVDFEAQNNKLPVSAVDQILTDFTTGAAGRPASGTINVSGQTPPAPPTPAVLSAAQAALPGWTITTD